MELMDLLLFYLSTVTSTERNYAQTDEKALTIIIAGVKKCHNYVYDHTFETGIDHKKFIDFPLKQDKFNFVSSYIMSNGYDHLQNLGI